MQTIEHSFSAFLREPNPLSEELNQADVILKRRDGADIRMTLDQRAGSQNEATALLAAMLPRSWLTPS